MLKQHLLAATLCGLLGVTTWNVAIAQTNAVACTNSAQFAHTNFDGWGGTNHERFGFFDQNGDGTITPDELAAASSNLGQELQTRFLTRYDTNADGAVTEDESLAVNEAATEQWLQHLLQQFDRNQDGAITSADFSRLRRIQLPPDLLAYDLNADGSLSNDELVAAAESKAQSLQQQLLAKYDANADGVITSDEALAVHQAAVAAKVQKFLDTFDTDKDGSVTTAEIQAVRGTIEGASHFRRH